MLVLSRKFYQDIIIGHNITVRVLKIERTRISLGIDAPPEVSVHRGEICDAIQDAKSNGLDNSAQQEAISVVPPHELPCSIAACRPKKPGGMLVLYRYMNERIVIGDDIIITVIEIRSDKVRLGIDAPIEVSVHRREVYEAIQRDRQAKEGNV